MTNKTGVPGVEGHKIVMAQRGLWRCTCGELLGTNRAQARTAQREHAAQVRQRPAGTLRERVLSRLIIEPATGCLLWDGSRSNGRYGKVKVNGRDVAVHRLMYEWFIGPIPPGLTIDHVRDRGCGHHHCASPDHLEAVTTAENTRRYHRKAAPI